MSKPKSSRPSRARPPSQPAPKPRRTTRERLQPPLEVETIAIDALRPNPRNARKHGPKQIAHLAASISQAGFVQPVLIDQDNQLIAGHGRTEAARQLGMKSVPAIRLSHLNAHEVRALALADNRIAELAEWDEAMLTLEFKELFEHDLDFSLADVTGFEAPRIERLVHGDDFASADPADECLAQLPAGPAITQLGDLFKIGEHRVICGDARDPLVLGRLMDGDKAAQVIADGPYNVPIDGHVSGKGRVQHREFAMGVGEMSIEHFTAFNRDWLASAAAVAQDGALIYAFMDGLHLAELIGGARQAGLSFVTLCAWAKSNAGMGGLYRSQLEHIAVFKVGKAKHVNNIALGRHGRNRSTLWSYPGVNSFGRERDKALAAHPTVKPVGLVADALLDASARGDIVLDPFLGSGTTLIAAERTKRRCRAVELDPLYVDSALDRFAAVLDCDPVRLSDGARWSKLRAAHKAPAQ